MITILVCLKLKYYYKIYYNMVILFTDDEHSWAVPLMSFDFSGVTNPLSLSRVIFSSPNEWSWLTVNDILERTSDYKYKDERRHKNFYEILECMRTLETLYKTYELYTMGGSHIGNHTISLKDEVKAIETVKTWIKFANHLHKLIGKSERLELTDRLCMKIARETRPTTFKMPNNERYYDDTKSVIVYLSPYEDNTKALKEKKLSDDCIKGENKINKFLEVKLK